MGHPVYELIKYWEIYSFFFSQMFEPRFLFFKGRISETERFKTQLVNIGRGEGGGERDGERAHPQVPRHRQQSGQQCQGQNHRKLYRLEVGRFIFSFNGYEG